MKNDDIILRINELMFILNLNISQFSSKIEVSQSNMSAMLSGKRSIGGGIINKIILSFDINKTWLLTGVGEMFKSIVSEAVPVYSFPYMMVPFVPISARAGYLRGFGDREYIDALSTLPAIVDKNYRGKYRIFEVEGDSMEDGTFRSIIDKDKVLGREVVKDHWKSKLHYNDWFFIIVHRSEGILIKEITEHNIETGEIKCHSLNSLFDDFVLNLGEVSELYSVVKVVERNIRK